MSDDNELAKARATVLLVMGQRDQANRTIATLTAQRDEALAQLAAKDKEISEHVLRSDCLRAELNRVQEEMELVDEDSDREVNRLTADLSSAIERAEKAEAYKPCEPCLEGRHDDCTGDCSSNCCAFAVAEARVDFIEALLTREKLDELISWVKDERNFDADYYPLSEVKAMWRLRDAILRQAGK